MIDECEDGYIEDTIEMRKEDVRTERWR